MKKLMLVRHAKSDWHNTELSDFDRPLNKRGNASAPEMAGRLLKKGLVPQYIVSSPALRAKTTAQLFADTLKLEEPVYNDGIYEAGYGTLLKIINNLPNEYEFIALFGHNPGISELVHSLSGNMIEMPTCAVAVVSFDIESWKMVSGGLGKMDYCDQPKNGN